MPGRKTGCNDNWKNMFDRRCDTLWWNWHRSYMLLVSGVSVSCMYALVTNERSVLKHMKLCLPSANTFCDNANRHQISRCRQRLTHASPLWFMKTDYCCEGIWIDSQGVMSKKIWCLEPKKNEFLDRHICHVCVSQTAQKYKCCSDKIQEVLEQTLCGDKQAMYGAKIRAQWEEYIRF